jgi:hypothetical protein
MLTALLLLCSTGTFSAAFANPIYDCCDDKNDNEQSGYAEVEAGQTSGYLDVEGRCNPPSYLVNQVHGTWIQFRHSLLAHSCFVRPQALQTMTCDTSIHISLTDVGGDDANNEIVPCTTRPTKNEVHDYIYQQKEITRN